MNWELRFAHHATAYLKRLDPRTRERILERLDQIAVDPFGVETKPLANAAGRRSAWVGDYRIVCSVDSIARVVSVSAIGPRGRVYRDL